jgi:lipid-binding SYLF domain-containing protein
MMNPRRFALPLAGIVLAALVTGAPAVAAPKAEIEATSDAALNRFYGMSARHHELVDKAAGVLVFGKVTKAGVGVGGEFGEGVLRVSGATTRFYSITSASVGLTLGVGEHSEVILFMTHDALDKFMQSAGWSIGGDASVAVVKSGAGGEYSTQVLAKPIIGFVFGEKGLLGDLSLEGSKVTRIKD